MALAAARVHRLAVRVAVEAQAVAALQAELRRAVAPALAPMAVAQPRTAEHQVQMAARFLQQVAARADPKGQPMAAAQMAELAHFQRVMVAMQMAGAMLPTAMQGQAVAAA